MKFKVITSKWILALGTFMLFVSTVNLFHWAGMGTWGRVSSVYSFVFFALCLHSLLVNSYVLGESELIVRTSFISIKIPYDRILSVKREESKSRIFSGFVGYRIEYLTRNTKVRSVGVAGLADRKEFLRQLELRREAQK